MRKETAAKLLDYAVDIDQKIVLRTEFLRTPLPSDSELGKSLNRIEILAMENAETLQDVAVQLKPNKRPSHHT